MFIDTTLIYILSLLYSNLLSNISLNVLGSFMILHYILRYTRFINPRNITRKQSTHGYRQIKAKYRSIAALQQHSSTSRDDIVHHSAKRSQNIYNTYSILISQTHDTLRNYLASNTPFRTAFPRCQHSWDSEYFRAVYKLVGLLRFSND